MDTPELDKQHACNEPRPPFDVLTDFWDWMEAEGIVLAEYGRAKERSVTCSKCKGRRFDAEGLTPRQQQLLRVGQLPDHERNPCPKCAGSGNEWVSYVEEDSLQPLQTTPTALFARFWKLDLDKIGSERRAILDELQQTAPRRCRKCMEAHKNEGHHCDTCLEAATRGDTP